MQLPKLVASKFWLYIFRKINFESKEWVKSNGTVKTGETAYTTKGDLKCKNYVIHTVGPIWKGGKYDEDNQLK